MKCPEKIICLYAKQNNTTLLQFYWLGSCPQVSHFNSCIFISRALVQKSLIFFLAFLSVGLLSSSLPYPSLLPFYWSGFFLKSPIFILVYFLVGLLFKSLSFSSLPSYWSVFLSCHVHPNLLTIKRGCFFEESLLQSSTSKNLQRPYPIIILTWHTFTKVCSV